MSSITLGPQYVVDGPVPQPPPYRLLAPGNPSVTIVEDPDAHWQAGAMVWTYPVDLPSVWDACVDGPGTFIKRAGSAIPLPVFSAYTIYYPITCTMRGINPDDIDGWQERARAALIATESYAVEREISQGIEIPLKPHFTDASVDLLAGGTATPAQEALSYLADAVGATGRQGLLHATPGAVIGFNQLDIYRDRDNLFSADGIPLVRGTGYLGATPSGGAAAGPGEAWAFATGPMKIYRGPIFGIPDTPAEALDRDSNTYTFIAERSYLPIWDTSLQAAILVDWTV